MKDQKIFKLKYDLRIDHFIPKRKAPIWTYIYRIESASDAQGDTLLSESTYEIQTDRQYAENQEALQCQNSESK